MNSHLQPGRPARPSVDPVIRVLVPFDVIITHCRVNAALKNAREHGTHQSTAGEDCCALPKFFRLVPATENIMAANKGRRFKDGLEESQDHNLPRVMRETGTEGYQSPDNNAAREVDARRQFLEGKVVWDLSENVATVEYCQWSVRRRIQPSWIGALLVFMMLSSLPLKFRSSLMPLT